MAHVEWKENALAFLFQNSRTEHEFRSDTLSEFCPELFKGFRAEPSGRFYLYGTYSLLEGGVLVLSYQKKVDFHGVQAVLVVALGMEAESVIVGDELLGHDVFHEHAFIDAQFAE